MQRPTRLILGCLGLLLVLFPLAVARPGLPVTLKADEPAYLGMALSLVEDGDLACDRGDVRRLFDRFPYLPIENVIMMSDDGWRTVTFGKPYLYSLLAAPAVALADYRGMVAFNMLLLLASAWMGIVYLRRFNPEWLASLFAVSFFLLSSAFAYVFWLQPEILNLFGVTACLFLAFHRPASTTLRRAEGRWWRRLLDPRLRPVLSATALTLAVYHKPMYAAIGVAALYRFWRRDGWRRAAAWLASAVVSMALVVGGSLVLTGQPIAYLGSDRLGIKIEDPEAFDELVASFQALSERIVAGEGVEGGGANTFAWLAYLPELHPRMFLENVGYFLWGRHTGLLLYLPFAAVAILLFLLHARRSAERWVIVGSLAAIALFFLQWLHYNWHGGAGFIGNRYFVSLYPAFLFLVTAIRPRAVLLAGYLAAGLFVAPVVFFPYGAPMPSPTLQAHTRGTAFEGFPIEQSVRAHIPGYDGITAAGIVFRGRSDLVDARDRGPATFWTRGAATTEIVLESARPLGGLLFEVSSLAPRNTVVLAVAGDRRELHFPADDPTAGERRLVELTPGRAERRRSQYGDARYVYRLEVTAATGRNPRYPDGRVIEPQFYQGAAITFLGSRDELEKAAHYRTSWRDARAPTRVAVGERFDVRAWLGNRGDQTWSSDGALAVALGAHWLDRRQRPVVYEGLRTPLAEPLAPGAERLVRLAIEAPAAPGRYILVLDAHRARLGWFSTLGAKTLHVPVDVIDPETAGGDAAPGGAGAPS